MLNLCLAVLSSALVSVTMRLSKARVKKETALLAVNYLLCSLPVSYTHLRAHET